MFHMSRRVRRTILCQVLVLILASLLSPCSAATDEVSRAGLVVVFDEDTVFTACVEFTEPEIAGVEVLRRAGLRVVAQASGGMGEAVCKIEDVGCDFPADQCFCECLGSPCVYWTYWYWQDGDWIYSGMGGSNRKLHDGDLDAWFWSDGQSKPPLIDFASLCVSPTDTPVPPTATPTVTPVTPTETPTMTPVPPTATPTQVETLGPAPTHTETTENSPRPAATKTETSTATSTRVPTETPVPTGTPLPTDTPLSTETPAPTETVEPPEATDTPRPAYAEPTDARSPTATRTSTRPPEPTASPVSTTTTKLAVPSEPANTAALGGPPTLAKQSRTNPGPGSLPAPLLASTEKSRPLLATSTGVTETPNISFETNPSESTRRPTETEFAGSPTADKVAMLISTSVAQNKDTPPSSSGQIEQDHNYNLLVSLVVFSLLLVICLVFFNRQRT